MISVRQAAAAAIEAVYLRMAAPLSASSQLRSIETGQRPARAPRAHQCRLHLSALRRSVPSFCSFAHAAASEMQLSAADNPAEGPPSSSTINIPGQAAPTSHHNEPPEVTTELSDEALHQPRLYGRAAAAAAAAAAANSDGVGLKKEDWWRILVECAQEDAGVLAGEGAALSGEGKVEQRTAGWLGLRQGRLTASALSNAIGMFDRPRREDPRGLTPRVGLWEEKVGLSDPQPPNSAMMWGTRMEPQAIAAYEALTGVRVDAVTFKVHRDDKPHGWLGVSPDGVLRPPSDPLPAGQRLPPAAHLMGPGEGLLEVKCPASPVIWTELKWYYLPQVQAQLEVMDKEWAHLFVWWQSGHCQVYFVPRDRHYWALLFPALSEYWWQHVVPARHAAMQGGAQAAEAFRPASEHRDAEMIRQLSKQVAARLQRHDFRC